MKVTDEMVQKAHALYWRSDVPSNEPKMRKALEAALDGYVLGPFTLTDNEREALAAHSTGATIQRCQHISAVLAGALDRAQHTLTAKDAQAVAGEWSEQQAHNVESFLADPTNWHPQADREICGLIKARLAAAPAPTGDVTDADVERAMAEFAEVEAGDEDEETLAMRRVLEGFARRCPAPTGDVLVRDLDGMDHDTIDFALQSEPHEIEHVLASMLRRRFPKPTTTQKTAQELADIIRVSIAQTGNIEGDELDELVRRAEKSEVSK